MPMNSFSTKIMREREAKMPVGIVKYATVLSFWTMIIVWEIEIMRVMSKLDQINSSSIKLAISFVEYDSTMLLLAGFTFLSSIFYIIIYQKKMFGIAAMLISFLFIVVALINGRGITNMVWI